MNPPSARPEIRNLKSLLHYPCPYRRQVLGAALALVLSSSAVLGIGGGLRYLIDDGLSKGNAHLLDRAFAIMIGVVLLLALTSYARIFPGRHMARREGGGAT